MSPLSDKDLDRLSREAAEQYDVSQNTSGWDAVQSRLNKEMPVKDDRDRKRFLFWLFFLALLTGSSLVWMLRSDAPEQIASRRVVIPAAPAETTTGGSTSPAAEVPATTRPGGELPAAVPGTSQDLAIHDGKTEAPPNSRSLTLNNIRKNTRPGIAGDPFLTPINKKDPIAASKGSKEAPITNTDKDTNADTDAIAITNADQSVAQADAVIAPPPAAVITNQLVADSPALKTPDALADSLAADSQVKKAGKPKRPKQIPLEFGILAGPDLSNVRFSHAGQPGLNIGLTVGYRFSNRWSVNTGVIYNKKYYKSLEKDFAKRGNLRWYDLDNIQGDCSMLDIPLNVRYDFSVKEKRRLFVSAGLSTYLMDKEYYEYNYYYNGVYKKGEWDTNTNSSYLFSIANFSVGYERRLGKHFSVQAEPYLKMPLKGIGYGNLQLNSYGINFSLKYNLSGQVFQKKQP